MERSKIKGVILLLIPLLLMSQQLGMVQGANHNQNDDQKQSLRAQSKRKTSGNTNNYCGTSWSDAETKCGTSCPSGLNRDCPSGQSCYGGITSCTDNSVIPCIEDSFVRGGQYQNQNFDGEYLWVKSDNSHYTRNTLIKFDVPSTFLHHECFLHLYIHDIGTQTLRTITLKTLSDNSWSESNVTWANLSRVASHTTTTFTINSNQVGSWLKVDVTEFISEGLVTFILENNEPKSSKNHVLFGTKELENGPYLQRLQPLHSTLAPTSSPSILPSHQPSFLTNLSTATPSESPSMQPSDHTSNPKIKTPTASPVNIMWSISNISKTLPDEVWKELFSSDELLLNLVIGWLSIPIAYILIHNLLLKFVQSYQKLEPDAQTVVIHHTLEAILLTLFFIPMSYLVLSVLFEEQSFEDLKAKFIPLSTLFGIIIAMYIIELASRYRYPRPMLVLHHIVACVDGVFLLGFKSTANVKTCLLLVYFITFEAVTFMGLLFYRLFPYNKVTPKVILTGIIVMALSRPFQLILILGFLFSAWNDLVKWHAVTQICITLFLTGIQIWSLKIHVGLWKRSLKKQKANKKVMALEDHADSHSSKEEMNSSNLDLSLDPTGSSESDPSASIDKGEHNKYERSSYHHDENKILVFVEEYIKHSP